jgi:DNA-binding winged helix-turn-helix (wHTH) protein/tetratricopeptide (TPR) repeat protein
MLKLADLANRSDFDAGPLQVSPARRLVAGPAGKAHLEPIVMKVFLLLLDAGGSVVTRDELFGNAWGGVFVGDDSLNRAIGQIRKVASETAPGLLEIETIPRTGYRLTGVIVAMLDGSREEAGPPLVTRRLLIGGGAVAATVLGTGLWWAAMRGRAQSRFDQLMAQGDEAVRTGAAFDGAMLPTNNSPTMVDLYQEAVRVDPNSARAWGLLAYFKSAAAEDRAGKDAEKAVAEAQDAIQRALALDPAEPNARVGLFILQGSMSDQATRDRTLRNILKTDPNNLPAITELMPIVQAAGLTRESWMWNERILRASPFAHAYLVVRALKLWILGRVSEADNVIDRVRALWPKDGFAIYVRFIIFALTGRPAAARAMLDGVAGFDQFVGPQGWPTALRALESPTRASIEAARVECLEAAHATPVAANDIVMTLCALGLKDAAFEVTDGFLLWRGKIVSKTQANGREMDDYNRRMTQWLFTPPCKLMRDDARFLPLCDAMGLTAYWRARGVRPDYQVYG